MRTSFGVLVMAAGLVVAGCGGGGDDDDDERLTQAEFIEQGNDICKEFQDRAEEAIEDEFPDADDENPPDNDELAELFSDEVIPDYLDTLDELAELRPPEAIEEDVEAAIAASRKSADEVSEDVARFLDSEDDPFEDSDEMLEDIGLDVCAE